MAKDNQPYNLVEDSRCTSSSALLGVHRSRNGGHRTNFSPHLAVASLIHHCKMSCGGQPWAYLEPSTRASTSHTPVITRLPPSPAATVPIMVDTRMDSHFSLARRIEQSQFSAASSATSDRRIPSGFENYAEKVCNDAMCVHGWGARRPVCAHMQTLEWTLMR